MRNKNVGYSWLKRNESSSSCSARALAQAMSILNNFGRNLANEALHQLLRFDQSGREEKVLHPVNWSAVWPALQEAWEGTEVCFLAGKKIGGVHREVLLASRFALIVRPNLQQVTNTIALFVK